MSDVGSVVKSAVKNVIGAVGAEERSTRQLFKGDIGGSLESKKQSVRGSASADIVGESMNLYGHVGESETQKQAQKELDQQKQQQDQAVKAEEERLKKEEEAAAIKATESR